MKLLMEIVLIALMAIQGIARVPKPILNPAHAIVPTGGRIVFKVEGIPANACEWRASGGNVTPSGIYLAPGSPGVFKVNVSFRRDSSITAEAEVKVVDVPFGRNGFNGETWLVAPAEKIKLPVIIPDMPEGLNREIKWTLESTSQGAQIFHGNVLISPKRGIDCVVLGRSKADPSKIRKIRLQVIQPDSELGITHDEPATVQLDPPRLSMSAGTTEVFQAHVTNASSDAVIWSIEGNPADATIDRNGVFTASRQGTYRVIAKSLSIPACRGTAEVTVNHAISETPNELQIPLPKGAMSYFYLGNFRVACIGGWSGYAPMDTVILWDSQQVEKFKIAGHMKESRLMPLGVSLGGERILICNGISKTRGADVMLRSAEIFDCSTGESRVLRSSIITGDALHYAHCGGCIVALADGNALILGGDDGNGQSSGAEMFDSKREVFTVIDPKPFPIEASTVTLPDGRVLIFGGRFLSGKKGPCNDILSFDPRTLNFRIIGSMTLARSGHTSTLLADGRVLIAGGCVHDEKSDVKNSTKQCEIYDPHTGGCSPTGDMSEPRAGHASALMPTGQVLCMGGSSWVRDIQNYCTTIDLFDPDSGQFEVFDHPRTGIVNPALFVLPDGGMFTGGTSVNFDPSKNPEIFSPCQ